MTDRAEQSSTSEATKARILLLAANPAGSGNRGFDREFRDIEEQIRRAAGRDHFEVVNAGAVRPRGLIDLLDRYEPYIVHFCGLGSSDGGIVLVDEGGEGHAVAPTVLGKVFATCKGNAKLIVLSSCYAAKQARAIAQHVDWLIAMTSTTSTPGGAEAARRFTTQLYAALAGGKDIEAAFERGGLLQEMYGQPLSFVLFRHGEQLAGPPPGTASECFDARDDDDEAAETLFMNVWYTPKEFGFFSWRNHDEGVLTIFGESATFQGNKSNLVLAGITDVKHIKMPGDPKPAWAEVHYEGGRRAFFADGAKMGMIFWKNEASKDIYLALRQLVDKSGTEQRSDSKGTAENS